MLDDHRGRNNAPPWTTFRCLDLSFMLADVMRKVTLEEQKRQKSAIAGVAKHGGVDKNKDKDKAPMMIDHRQKTADVCNKIN